MYTRSCFFFEVSQGKIVLATVDVRKLGQRANGVCTQQSDGFANG